MEDKLFSASQHYLAKALRARTARTLTSGEYLLRLGMTPSSQVMGFPAIPGRFNLVFG